MENITFAPAGDQGVVMRFGSVVSEAVNQMTRHVIINKTYRQFYSDDVLKVSVKAL